MTTPHPASTLRFDDSESNLVQHALFELKLAGYTAKSPDKMDYDIWLSTMNMVQMFSMIGHSGYSAAMHSDMIFRLLKFEPLGPLTDHPAEWVDHGEMMKPGVETWQNRRDGRMFSEDGGKTYYSVDELRTGWRRRLFGRRGKMYTSVIHIDYFNE